jgi:hypothetical protein
MEVKDGNMVIAGVRISKKFSVLIFALLVNFAKYSLGVEIPNELLAELNKWGIVYLAGQGVYDWAKLFLGK